MISIHPGLREIVTDDFLCPNCNLKLNMLNDINSTARCSQCNIYMYSFYESEDTLRFNVIYYEKHNAYFNVVNNTSEIYSNGIDWNPIYTSSEQFPKKFDLASINRFVSMVKTFE